MSTSISRLASITSKIILINSLVQRTPWTANILYKGAPPHLPLSAYTEYQIEQARGLLFQHGQHGIDCCFDLLLQTFAKGPFYGNNDTHCP